MARSVESIFFSFLNDEQGFSYKKILQFSIQQFNYRQTFNSLLITITLIFNMCVKIVIETYFAIVKLALNVQCECVKFDPNKSHCLPGHVP